MKKIIICLILCLLACPSFSANYSSIDRRAKNVPEQYNKSITELVKYLIQPYTKDEQKARVLLAWIVYHVDYDAHKEAEYKRRNKKYLNPLKNKYRPDVSTGDIFETRLGVCGDIADLYRRMLGLAGLDSASVSGVAGYNVKPQDIGDFAHAWTAVKIDGKWELVDPTWAIGGGNTTVMGENTSTRKHAREVEKRQKDFAKNSDSTRKNRYIRDEWFLPKPRDMIKTHFPNEERWQLLPTPKSIHSFLE